MSTAECPICQTYFPISELNDHANFCLKETTQVSEFLCKEQQKIMDSINQRKAHGRPKSPRKKREAKAQKQFEESEKAHVQEEEPVEYPALRKEFASIDSVQSFSSFFGIFCRPTTKQQWKDRVLLNCLKYSVNYLWISALPIFFSLILCNLTAVVALALVAISFCGHRLTSNLQISYRKQPICLSSSLLFRIAMLILALYFSGSACHLFLVLIFIFVHASFRTELRQAPQFAY